MKKLILSELLLLFLATTFITDSINPGWYQQPLPVNKTINDIFFLDSLKGWTVTTTSISDTGFILQTQNGGNNWTIQYNVIGILNSVQFLDVNIGYVAGGNGPAKLYKTTDGGNSWINISSAMLGFGTLEDMFFVNKDTGWVCDENTFGGLAKTIDGGFSWQLELNDTYRLKKLFFINKDTGWAGSNNYKLYRTTNGGQAWNLQYNFNSNTYGMYFTTRDTGFIAGAFGSSSIAKTTDGGFNWSPTNNATGGSSIFFITKKMGFDCAGFSIVEKTTDGGNNWFRQTVPSGGYQSIQFVDSSKGWSVGTILIHTSDGGGPPAGIQQIGNEIPKDFKLYQNYPNPFNISSRFKIQIPAKTLRGQVSKFADIKVVVYDITGKKLTTLIDQKLNAGIYEITFNGTNYSSGVYFYSLYSDGIMIDTKRMILLK